MADFILTDNTFCIFLREMTMAGAPSGEICDYLHSIRTKPLDAPFFQESKEDHFPRWAYYKQILHENPEISFSEFCRKAVAELGRKFSFPLCEGEQKSGALYGISLLNRVPDHCAMKLLCGKTETFSCREDLTNAVSAGTGLSREESFRLLIAMFLYRFTFEQNDHGICCDTTFPINSMQYLGHLFQPSSVSVSLSSIIPAGSTSPETWELFLNISDPWLSVIHLEIWDHGCYHRLFTQAGQERRREFLRVVRRRRMEFLALLQKHSRLSRTDAERVMESLFYNSGKLFFTKKDVMIWALTVGYQGWNKRTWESHRLKRRCFSLSDKFLR